MQHLVGKVMLYLPHGSVYPLARSNEDGRRRDVVFRKLRPLHARERADLGDAVYLVAEELHAHHYLRVCQGNIHRIALHAESPAREFYIIADILRCHQHLQKVIHR